MDTFYVRHSRKLDVDAATMKKLWRGRRIAIHFPLHRANPQWRSKDNASLHAEDYPERKGGQQMRTLLELAEHGGYVAAEFHGFEGCLVGLVPPGSRPERVRGRWGELNGHHRQAVLKSLALRKAKVISPSDAATLLLGRPQQGTISHWRAVEAKVADIVNGVHRKPSLNGLHTYQQEVMCSEFLRSKSARSLRLPRIAHLLTPVGRTMRDVDIIGMTASGDKVIVQVTFRPLNEALPKFEQLRQFQGPKTHLVFFCRCAERSEKSGVTIFPLNEVFARFTRTLGGKAWLHAL